MSALRKPSPATRKPGRLEPADAKDLIYFWHELAADIGDRATPVEGGPGGDEPAYTLDIERLIDRERTWTSCLTRGATVYRILCRLDATSVTVLHRFYGVRHRNERGSFEDLGCLAEYTQAVEDERQRIVEALVAERVYAAALTSFGDPLDRATASIRRATALEVTTADAVRLALEIRAPADDKPARAAAVKARERFTKAVTAQAEAILVAACDAYRAAKGQR